MKIAPSTKVTLHFALALADGTLIDSTYEGPPASFVVGDGRLPEAIEALLHGLEAGASVDHKMPADPIFGSVREEHQVWLPRTDFPADITLEVGLALSFGGVQTKGESVGVVTELQQDRVLVDLNHPLAGRMLHFKADVLEVVPDLEAPQ